MEIGKIIPNTQDYGSLKQPKAVVSVQNEFKGEFGDACLPDNPTNRCLVSKPKIDIQQIKNSPEYQRLVSDEDTTFIDELNQALEKHPGLVKDLIFHKLKNGEPRFGSPVEIVIINRAYEKNPTLTKYLINARLKQEFNVNNTNNPYFYNAFEIQKIVHSEEKYPEYVKRYLEETKDYYGETIPAHSGYNIDKLVNKCLKNKAISDKLLLTKHNEYEQKVVFLEEKYTYSTDDVFSIMCDYEQAPEFVEKLIDEKIYSSSREKSRFSAKEIKDILKLREEDLEFIEKIVFQKNPDIGISPRFTVDEMKELLDLYKKDPDSVNFVLNAKTGKHQTASYINEKEYNLFFFEEMKEAISLYKKHPDLMKLLTESPHVNLFGDEIIDIFNNIDEKYYPVLEKIISADDTEAAKQAKNMDMRQCDPEIRFNCFLMNLSQKTDLLEIGLWNKENIDELSPNEKSKLLNTILKYKNEASCDLNKISPLLPKDDDEYVQKINEISTSIINDIKPLTSDEQAKFEKEFGEFLSAVKTADLSSSKTKQVLSEKISKYFPEIFNKAKENNIGKTLGILKNVVNNPKFEELSDSDKKVLTFAALFNNISDQYSSNEEACFNAYFSAKRFNLSENEAKKIFKMTECTNLLQNYKNAMNEEYTKVIKIGYHEFCLKFQDREDLLNRSALKLKEDNDFELAKILYSSNGSVDEIQELNNELQSRIEQMRMTDFMMPQTSPLEYRKLAKEKYIEGKDKSYKVKVVNSSDIKDFCAFAHAIDTNYLSGGSRNANLTNFKIFKDFWDDKVVCTGYITNNNPGLVNQFNNGLLLEVDNDKQYIGAPNDIFSLSKNVNEMLAEYFTDRHVAKLIDGNVVSNRIFREAMSAYLKSELYGVNIFYGIFDDKVSNPNLKNKLYDMFGMSFGETTPEIQADVNKKYAERIRRIKKELNGTTMSLEKLEKIDPKFAKVFKKIIRKNKGGFLHSDEKHNEFLISNPKITAIYTQNLQDLPEEYLKYAEENDLPIVVINLKQELHPAN